MAYNPIVHNKERYGAFRYGFVKIKAYLCL